MSSTLRQGISQIESHDFEMQLMVACAMSEPGVSGLLHAVSRVDDADIVSLCSLVNPQSRQLLFYSSHAVLANSGREPFGLVGLEPWRRAVWRVC